MVREGDKQDDEIAGYLECGWAGTASGGYEGQQQPLAPFEVAPL